MSKAQDTLIYVEVAAALIAGYLVYKTVKNVAAAPGAIMGGVKNMVAEVKADVTTVADKLVSGDPALPETDPYSKPAGDVRYSQWVSNFWNKLLGNPLVSVNGTTPVTENVAPTLSPTQNTDNQTQAETQRLVNKATAQSGQTAIGYTDSQQIIQAIPINFGIIDPSKW